MAQLDARRLYAANTAPTEEQIDAFIDDIETFLNVTKLNDDNIQTAGITASTKVDDGTISTAKFANNSVTTAKITDANVTTAKIADSAVTTAKIADSAVTTAKIADSAVTTAKIADGAVTGVKVNTNLQISSDVSYVKNFTSADSSSGVVMTDVSVTITSSGNPIIIGWIADGTDGGTISLIDSGPNDSDTRTFVMYLLRNGSHVTGSKAFLTAADPGALGAELEQRDLYLPVSTFSFVDQPAAGTHVYTFKVYADVSFGNTVSCFVVGRVFALEVL